MKPNCTPSRFDHIKCQRMSFIQEVERTVIDKHSTGMSLATLCESGVVHENPFMSSKAPNCHVILEIKKLDEQPDDQISYPMELSSVQFADSGPDIPNLIDLKNIKQEIGDESLSNFTATPTVIKEECMDIGEKMFPYQTVPLVKTDNIEAINECEQMHDVNSENWKIKIEELDIKEEHSESIENNDDCGDRKHHIQSSQEFNVKTQQLRQLQTVTGRDQSLGQVNMFNCHQCDYQSKYKGDLRKHFLRHKSPEEVDMFKCHHCDYQTRYKSDLPKHILRHKIPGEVTVFKCGHGTYQSMYNYYLNNNHRHKKAQEDFKWHRCAYETIHKSDLKAHLILHKSPEKVNMFKCDQCNFQTIHKKSLNRHFLRHKSPEEVKMFKCDLCAYKSVRKSAIRAHFLLHKSREEVNIFKCDLCAYTSIRKYAIKAHLLVHKSPEEVNMFKCGQCDFQSVYRTNLKRHLRVHKNPEEVNNMLKCDQWDFQIIHKT